VFSGLKGLLRMLSLRSPILLTININRISMNIPKLINPQVVCKASGQPSSCRQPVLNLGVITTLLFALSLMVASAANVTLKTSDAAGTSSFTGSTNWSDGFAPSAANAYLTGANVIRTTNYVNNGGGDSTYLWWRVAFD
jgi:hypothetical protein